MPALLVILRDILFLRRGPQDLPYSPLLLAIVAAVCLMISLWAGSILMPKQTDTLLRVLAGLLLHLGFLYLLLNALQHQARFVQTALASLLVDVLFTAVVLPLLPIFEPFSRNAPTPDNVNGVAAIASLLLLALGVWRIVVDAHILRAALEVRLLAALLINTGLFFAAQVVLGALFGVSEGS